ncbi:MAG TPA: hypothetical protein VFY23_09460 [Candidatus Limnocylindrales bacterium]|nr:hypothetical protein [Candidatus Limnocylindrales bacterium]
MTAPDRDFDRIATAWLDLMPSEAPERVIHAVNEAVATTPQVRRPALGGRRSPRMHRFALIAAAAALGIALLGGALILGGGASPAPIPPPSASAAAIAAPSAVPATPGPSMLPEALRANWVASDTAAGDDASALLRLVVTTNGNGMWTVLGDGSQTPRSVPVEAGAADEILVHTEREAPGCPVDALGRYRWNVSEDRLTLNLELVEDDCTARAEAFPRQWTRTHNGRSDGGTAVVTDVGPIVQVTLPPGTYTQRALTDVAEIDDPSQPLLLYVFKDPQAYADPCASPHELVPWTPGAQAFIDGIRANPAMTDVQARPMTVGGAPAFEVTLTASTTYPACSSGDPFRQWTPRSDPEGGWWLSGGDSDRFFVVDAPGATLLVQVLEIDSPSLDGIISSISFRESLAPAP